MENKKDEEKGNLPDEESKKLAALDAEEEAEKKEKGEDKKPEDNEDDAGKKSKPEKDDEDIEDEEEEEEPPKRSPKLMPAWKHEVEKDKWEKEKAGYAKEIETLNQKLIGKSEPAQEEAIKKFAEKHSWDEETVKDFLGLLPKSPAFPEDIKKDLETLKESTNRDKQERGFTKFFEKDVNPLMEKEGLTQDQQDKVRRKIHTLAFTTKYVDNDIDEIYIIAKAKGELDNIILPKGKKSAEGSRPGMGVKGGGGKAVADMTEAEALESGDDVFKEWSEFQEKNAPDNRTWSTP